VPARVTTHKSILVVEDSVNAREAMAFLLREAGRTVVEAADGEDALAKLDVVERPCLILLDLRMPRMDGFEFLRRLKDHPSAGDFSVLVMSAHSQVSATEHHPRVVGTLPKPFTVDMLLSWVNAHC
jgi:chemosensory pili system protein ChpA (sensor histidine kinase/response regulator)